MKRKLLFLLCALLTSVGMWAYTTTDLTNAGWSQVTSLPTPLSDYYFVFVDDAGELMLDYGTGVHQDTDKMTMYYRTNANPITTPTMVWTLANNTAASGAYSIKNATEPTLYLQCEWKENDPGLNYTQPWCCHTHDNGAGNGYDKDWCAYNIVYSSNKWTIQTWRVRELAGRYVGPWDEAFDNGAEVAGNKSGEYIGYFQIYAIKRSEAPLDFTSKIVNPSFESATDKGQTSMTGWTNDNNIMYTQDNNSLDGKDGTYYAERWWDSNSIDLHQTTQSSLPAGFYRITALAKAETGNNILLYAKAGSNEEVTTAVSTVQDYNVEVYQSNSGVIKLGLKGSHTAQTHVGVDNFRLIFLGDLKADLTALQGTIDASYLNNATYTNVGGVERSNLVAAKSVTAASETAAAYATAISTVQDAIDAFVGAKDNYDALATINAKITAVGTLEYASSTKKPSTHAGTSSSDAAIYATSLTTALRAYVESNALAEGVDGATDYTSEIADACCPSSPSSSGSGDFVEITGTGWTISRIRANSGSGWTDSEGTLHQPYYDTNGSIYNGYTGVKTTSMSQTVSDLPRGKYLLTVTARSSNTFKSFYIRANGAQENINNAAAVFGNSWDDTSVLFTVGDAGTAEILLYAEKNNDGDQGRWFSADNFRLVRIGDATVSTTISSTGWTTFASAYPLDLHNMTASTGDVKAYYASSVAEGKVTMTSTDQIGVIAGEGIMLKGTASATITIPIEPSGSKIVGNKLVGCVAETELDVDANKYVLVKNGDKAEFQSLASYGATIPAGKAYLDANAGASARLSIVFEDDDPTAINAIEAAEETEGLEDGKYLIDGKIVIVKNGVKYSANGQIIK